MSDNPEENAFDMMTKKQQAITTIRAIIEALMIASPKIIEQGPEAVEANLNFVVSHVWRLAEEYFTGYER